MSPQYPCTSLLYGPSSTWLLFLGSNEYMSLLGAAPYSIIPAGDQHACGQHQAPFLLNVQQKITHLSCLCTQLARVLRGEFQFGEGAFE